MFCVKVFPNIDSQTHTIITVKMAPGFLGNLLFLLEFRWKYFFGFGGGVWALRIAKSVKRISRARYSKLGTRTLVTSPTVHAIKPQIWKDHVGNISTMLICTAEIMCQNIHVLKNKQY